MLATLRLDARRTGHQMPDPHRLGKVGDCAQSALRHVAQVRKSMASIKVVLGERVRAARRVCFPSRPAGARAC